MADSQFYFALVNPLIALIFCLAFAGIWFRWPHYRHLPSLSAAFLCLGLGFISYEYELFLGPESVNLGANLCYVLAVALACNSALTRKKLPSAIMPLLMIIASGTLPFAWYLLVQPSVQARIMVVSLMFTAMTILTFWRLAREPDKSLSDLLFAGGLGLAIIIAFVRPLLILSGMMSTESVDGFSFTGYWASVQAFTPLLSFFVATLFIVGMGLDIIDHLKNQAERDQLTHLLNRRGFETAGADAVAKDFAASRQSALLVADIDEFKKITEAFGHKVGDGVILGVAEVLAKHGQAMLAARTGGDEFALYFNDVSRAELLEIGRSIRSVLAQHRFSGLPPEWQPTISMGMHLSYRKESLSEMMARADKALYLAKEDGKGKAVMTPVQLQLASRNGSFG